jgi:hypothetical protein
MEITTEPNIEQKNEISIYDMVKKPDQILYDSLNILMFSKNPLVIQKLLTKINIYNSIKDLYGDILEFGVYKGATLALWCQLKKLYEPNSNTKIIGFDFFNSDDTLKSLNGENKILMNQVLSRANKSELDMNNIKEKCDFIIDNSIILIKGDASKTSKEFNDKNPGARIKLLYLDMDVAEPTYNVLNNLWDKIVVGGKVVFDEYGFHKWDESTGADKFLKKIPGKYTLSCTNVCGPTLIATKIE